MKSVLYHLFTLFILVPLFLLMSFVLTTQQAPGGPPWGRLGIGWLAALLLVLLIFLVLIGVTSFAAPNILLIAFALVALALLL